MKSSKITQFKVGFDNFSYVISCLKTHKAAIVDPSSDATKSIDYINTHQLQLEFILLTHHHSDHSYATEYVKNKLPSKIVASKSDGNLLDFDVDIFISDNEQLLIGHVPLTFILTPGHTKGSICILVDNVALLTGDTLFIGDCGRTDLPGGDLFQMYQTLQEKIIPLPDHLIVYPGHDYGPIPFDTLGHQKQTNKTLLAKTIDEFSKIP
jgi:glyoxylase-like metal-dependent hydrolase (beta-lactamase superfamily II)